MSEQDYCEDEIKRLDFIIEDKYRVISTLYYSLIDTANKEGIVFIEKNEMLRNENV